MTLAKGVDQSAVAFLYLANGFSRSLDSNGIRKVRIIIRDQGLPEVT